MKLKKIAICLVFLLCCSCTLNNKNNIEVAVLILDNNTVLLQECVKLNKKKSIITILDTKKYKSKLTGKGALCSMLDKGCGVKNCFCQCQNMKSCEYWHFYYKTNKDDDFSLSMYGLNQIFAEDKATYALIWKKGNMNLNDIDQDIKALAKYTESKYFESICNSK